MLFTSLRVGIGLCNSCYDESTLANLSIMNSKTDQPCTRCRAFLTVRETQWKTGSSITTVSPFLSCRFAMS